MMLFATNIVFCGKNEKGEYLNFRNNCLKDNIFTTAGKRSATRGIDTLKNAV